MDDILSVVEIALTISTLLLTFIGMALTKFTHSKNQKNTSPVDKANEKEDLQKSTKKSSEHMKGYFNSTRICFGGAKGKNTFQLKSIPYNKENTNLDAKEELIKDECERAILESKIHFWLSLITSCFGFIFVITIILVYNIQWYEYMIKIFSGITIEAVSVLFFTQAKSAREKASESLNRLREDRQYEKSIFIADSIEDEKIKALVKAEIALSMCGAKNADLIVEKIKKDS